MFQHPVVERDGRRPGGTGGIDDAVTRLHDVGAEIMGANNFAPPGWHEDQEWKGWWGPIPFHTPVFVLTHHPPVDRDGGGTTFHFIDASPAEALETASEAAGGHDVRIGGGATVIQDFLAAGLVDPMHIVLVPILLGQGVRLWDGLEGLEKAMSIESVLAQRSHARAVARARVNRLDREPGAALSPGRNGGTSMTRLASREPAAPSAADDWTEILPPRGSAARDRARRS